MADEGHSRTPRSLDCSNMAAEWPKWKQNFMVWMIATGKMEKPEKNKIATFIWLIGEQGAVIYNTLFPNDGTENSMLGETRSGENAVIQRSLDDVIKKFDDYCLPQKNTAMESFKFNMVAQKEKQSISEFETELRKQLPFCDFKCSCGALYEDRMLRDRIIIGVYDKKLQMKLLDGIDDSLAKVLDTCKIYEAAELNKSILEARTMVASLETEGKKKTAAVERFCYNCGGTWSPRHAAECRAKDITCHTCLKVGHYARMCRQKGKSQQRKDDIGNNGGRLNNKRGIGSIAWCDIQGMSIECKKGKELSKPYFRITSVESNRTKWTKEYQIEGKTVKFKIDTGADVNCIPLVLIKSLKIDIENENNDFPVYDYSNNKLQVFGTVKLKCVDLQNNTEHQTLFLVVDDKFEPILGLDSCIKFGLVKRMDVDKVALPDASKLFIAKYSEMFQGFGRFPGEYKIYLKENSKPVLHYRKRIPHTLMDRLKTELNSMVRDGIISVVDYPTDWVNNLQIVEKANGRLRICLDPRPLNECIKREHFLIPTVEDLISGLADAKIFTVIDLTSGFWHMSLERASSDLTTFMTPFGRYKFNRLPFGLSCAPEMFQKTMVRIFGDIPGVFIYFDDILIGAKDLVEHDKVLETVMQRAKENNVKFNWEKIQYRRESVEFMGNEISCNGIKAGRKYCEAILGIEKPKNRADVLRLLGLVKYLARFIPNLSKITAGLRNLTRLDVNFKWTEEHEIEFRNLLDIIASEPILAVYNPRLPVRIQTDASKDGLGCVLIQEGHPVAFASRTLSKNEQKWAQIEKELLAIVFACQRFHYFVYGREFTVESDHKPLETLSRRDIDDVTTRLQRMFMILLKYPLMAIVYKPGKDMLVADCLSRAQLPEEEELKDLSGVIHRITELVCLSEENFNYYRNIVNEDEKYSRICSYVRKGWPNFHRLDNLSQHFHKLKSRLHVENGLLLLDHRLVIPDKLQGKIAKWLHSSHLGIEKTLARARGLYYWPRMGDDIREVVRSCAICEKFRRNH